MRRSRLRRSRRDAGDDPAGGRLHRADERRLGKLPQLRDVEVSSSNSGSGGRRAPSSLRLRQQRKPAAARARCPTPTRRPCETGSRAKGGRPFPRRPRGEVEIFLLLLRSKKKRRRKKRAAASLLWPLSLASEKARLETKACAAAALAKRMWRACVKSVAGGEEEEGEKDEEFAAVPPCSLIAPRSSSPSSSPPRRRRGFRARGTARTRARRARRWRPRRGRSVRRESVGGKREEEVERERDSCCFERQREIRSRPPSLFRFPPFSRNRFFDTTTSPIASETIARTLSSITSSATLGAAGRGGLRRGILTRSFIVVVVVCR